MGWYEVWAWSCVEDVAPGSGGFSSGSGGSGGVTGGLDTTERLRRIEIEEWWEKHEECHKFLESAKFAGDPEGGKVAGECVFDKWHRMRLVRTFCEMLKLLSRNQRDNTIYNCLIEQWETYTIICDDREINPRFDGRHILIKHESDRSIISNYFADELKFNLDAGPGTGKNRRLHLSFGQLHDHEGILGLMLANCYGTKESLSDNSLEWYQVLASMLLNDNWRYVLTCDLVKRAVESLMDSKGITDMTVAKYVRERCKRGTFFLNIVSSANLMYWVDLCDGTVFLPRRDAEGKIIPSEPGVVVAKFPNSAIDLVGPGTPCNFMLFEGEEGLEEDIGYTLIRKPIAMGV